MFSYRILYGFLLKYIYICILFGGFFLEYMVRDQSSFIFLQVAIHLFQNQLFKSASEAWNESLAYLYFVSHMYLSLVLPDFCFLLVYLVIHAEYNTIFLSDILWYNLVPCLSILYCSLSKFPWILLFIVYFL